MTVDGDGITTDDVSNSFDEAGYPLFGWKDGSPMNLRIVNISAPGPVMTFTVVPPAEGVLILPGRIEAEAYRAGGQNVGWSQSGEWLAYDVNADAGAHTIRLTFNSGDVNMNYLLHRECHPLG